jgi:hypothetical protein
LGTSRRALSQVPRGCLAGLGTAATMAVANSHAVVGPALAWPGRSALGRVLNQRMTLDSLPQLQHPLPYLNALYDPRSHVADLSVRATVTPWRARSAGYGDSGAGLCGMLFGIPS